MWMAALVKWWVGLLSQQLFDMLAMLDPTQIALLRPLPGEDWDGGTHCAGIVSALAPTPALSRTERE